MMRSVLSKRHHISALLMAFVIVLSVLAPLLPMQDPLTMDVAGRFLPPSISHLLGQDEYGRDILARLVWATRNSIFVAIASATLSAVVGTAFGILAGYVRGFAELLVMRSMDVVLCFPPLLLAMLAVTLYGPGPITLIPVIAIVFVPNFTRVAQASVLTVRSQDYVEAVRSMGATNARVMLATILPNIAGPLIVQFSFAVAITIVLESGLSFLGLGVVPPAPSLGLMIGTGRSTLSQDPMLLLWPCLVLTMVILILNGFCDHLRDTLDPNSRRSGLRELRGEK